MNDIETGVVYRLRQELSNALNSLGGLTPEHITQNYFVLAALHIARVSEGYLSLKGLGQDIAAKQMIRPLIETEFRILAVSNNPSYLLSIAFSEINDDKKWMKAIAGDRYESDGCELVFETQKTELVAAFLKDFPGTQIPNFNAKVDMASLADMAKIPSKYKIQYRFYCRHTHGNLSAMVDFFGELDVLENLTVASCLETALRAVRDCGGSCPNLESLVAEIAQL